MNYIKTEKMKTRKIIIDIIKVIAVLTILITLASLIYGIITGGADTSYLD